MPEPKVFNAATGQWVHGAAITDPVGGATVDAQARTATTAILSALRAAGILAGGTQMPLSHVFNGPTFAIALTGTIADPAGGATIDAQARTAINSLLTVLRNAGIVAGGTAHPSLIAMTFDEDTASVTPGAAIVAPTGGTPIDAECRTAISAALTACRSGSLIPQD